MQNYVIKTVIESIHGNISILQQQLFRCIFPEKFFLIETCIHCICFYSAGSISLQMINRPQIRRNPFRTPTTDQRIKFRFITRNQAQHQCNERQQEELSFHNNNSSTPVPGRATNKQKSVGTVLSPVPRIEALVCPSTVRTSNAEPTLLCITHNTTLLQTEKPTKCHKVYEYTP